MRSHAVSGLTALAVVTACGPPSVSQPRRAGLSIAPAKLRPIAPPSFSTVVSGRVEFRWTGGAQGYVELSRARDFSGGLYRIEGEGSGVPSNSLSRGIWFWRVVDRRTARSSSVWPLVVTAEIDVPVKSGTLRGYDYNGDGLGDVAIPGQVILGDRKRTGSRGASASLGRLVPGELDRDQDEPPLQWGRIQGIGDVDGNGCSDAMVFTARRAMRPDLRVPVRVWLAGQPTLAERFEARGVLRIGGPGVGDVNGDGYADLAACAERPPEACTLYAGSAAGPSSTVLVRLPGYRRVFGGGDVDGDGIADFVGTSARPELAIHRGRVTGLRAEPDRSLPLAGPVELGVLIDDFDADGLADVLGMSRRESGTEVWLVPGSGDAGKLSILELGIVPANARVGDLNWTYLKRTGPGLRGTLLVAPWTDERPDDRGLYQAQQTEKHRFRFPPFYQPVSDAALGNWRAESVGDFDGDGSDDLLLVRVEDVDGTAQYSLHFGSSRAMSAKSEGLPLSGEWQPKVIPLEPGD